MIAVLWFAIAGVQLYLAGTADDQADAMLHLVAAGLCVVVGLMLQARYRRRARGGRR